MNQSKGFGKSSKWKPPVKLAVSDVTGKWLTQILFQGVWRVITAHYDRRDAEFAASRIQEVFGSYTTRQLRDQKIWSKALGSLNCPNDDEVIGVFKQGVLHTDPTTTAQANAILTEFILDD